MFFCCRIPPTPNIGSDFGAGTIGAVLNVIGAILLAAFAMIYHPKKRARQRRREAKDAIEVKQTQLAEREDDKSAGIEG